MKIFLGLFLLKIFDGLFLMKIFLGQSCHPTHCIPSQSWQTRVLNWPSIRIIIISATIVNIRQSWSRLRCSLPWSLLWLHHSGADHLWSRGLRGHHQCQLWSSDTWSPRQQQTTLQQHWLPARPSSSQRCTQTLWK